MSDLVKRLREYKGIYYKKTPLICIEAANEIERLKAVMKAAEELFDLEEPDGGTALENLMDAVSRARGKLL